MRCIRRWVNRCMRWAEGNQDNRKKRRDQSEACFASHFACFLFRVFASWGVVAAPAAAAAFNSICVILCHIVAVVAIPPACFFPLLRSLSFLCGGLHYCRRSAYHNQAPLQFLPMPLSPMAGARYASCTLSPVSPHDPQKTEIPFPVIVLHPLFDPPDFSSANDGAPAAATTHPFPSFLPPTLLLSLSFSCARCPPASIRSLTHI